MELCGTEAAYAAGILEGENFPPYPSTPFSGVYESMQGLPLSSAPLRINIGIFALSLS